MTIKPSLSAFGLLALFAMTLRPERASAFLSPNHAAFHRLPLAKSKVFGGSPSSTRPAVITAEPPLSRSCRASTKTELRSFFGLGLPEVGIILLAGIIVLGPQKITEFSKEAGSVAGKAASGLGDEWKELKAVPEEFQKGLEEGEINARSRKAKVMDDVGSADQ